MALSLDEIREIIKAPKHKDIIAKAINLEHRLRFHTETNLSPNDIIRPVTEFLDWVKKLLPKDKYNIFLQLFRFPISTPSLTEEIYRELERIFYSRNANSNFAFAANSLLNDWQAYRNDKLKESTIWKEKGWKYAKTAVNSVLIVDLPAKQVDELPEPYFYWLPISEVIDFKTPNGTNFDWIIFRQPENKIAVFDDAQIAVYQLNEKNEITGLISKQGHDLGYCPARFFWSDVVSESVPALKRNPITKELSNLDWYLFFSLSKRHLDLYAPYPIYSAYEADCDFENNATGDYCDGGFLRNSTGNYIISTFGELEACPKCSSKRIAGPGSFIEVPIPTKDGVSDMRNPVQITTIDEASLNYNVKEVERLKYEIFISCVGAGGVGAVSEKEAINESQVMANFENKTSVLRSLKRNFEGAQLFVDETICKLRYGVDFKGASIDWGTDFYVLSIQELYDRYKYAKTNGASEAELDSLSNQIIETEYKNNPMQMKRMLILKQLEPYRHFTMQELSALSSSVPLDTTRLIIKLNFSSYIDKFERENINIVDFGSATDFKTKIDNIYKTIYEYAITDASKSTIIGTTRAQTGASETEGSETAK